jgi:hypothetical protein
MVREYVVRGREDVDEALRGRPFERKFDIALSANFEPEPKDGGTRLDRSKLVRNP